MSYKLEKPYTDKDYADFVVEHNHNNGRIIYETENEVFALEAYEIIKNGYPVINENYQKELAKERKVKFESEFFEIPNIGWYRKVPRGYSSAIESINTAFNAVLVLNSLPADYLIFYTKPDFNQDEQCTEEWLIANQFKNKAMTKEEFMQFYANFVTAWNNLEHLQPETQIN